MMQEMLDQQRRGFMGVLAQELANAWGWVPVVNEPVVVEQVNNGPVPMHTVQEGNNDDLESYQGPEQLEV